MIKAITFLLGMGFVAAGIAGFIPAISPMHDMDVFLPDTARLALGLFPVNAIHNAAHIIYGALGVLAFRNLGNSLLYTRSVFFIYGVLAVLGLIPATRELLGLMPIGGNDVVLHAALAIVGFVGGYLLPRPIEAPRSA